MTNLESSDKLEQWQGRTGNVVGVVGVSSIAGISLSEPPSSPSPHKLEQSIGTLVIVINSCCCASKKCLVPTQFQLCLISSFDIVSTDCPGFLRGQLLYNATQAKERIRCERKCERWPGGLVGLSLLVCGFARKFVDAKVRLHKRGFIN